MDALTNRNEDWLRTRSWDLPTDYDALIQILGPERALALLDLPAGEAMPADIRTKLEKLKKDGSPSA